MDETKFHVLVLNYSGDVLPKIIGSADRNKVKCLSNLASGINICRIH